MKSSARKRPALRIFLGSLFCGLTLAGCGGDSNATGGGQSGIIGTEVSKPGGGRFFVDQNQSGGTSRLAIAEMFWARLVDIYDVDANGDPGPQPLFEDFAISESIQSNGTDYLLETNPITQRTRLVILRTDDPNDPNDAFNTLLLQAVQSLPPITPKNDDGTDPGPFSFVARNSTVVVRFNDCLDDRGDAARDLVDTVKVLTGYPPTQPFAARILFDPNHGALVGGGFHTTRVLIDMTISESEAANLAVPLPVNALGLPASLTTSGLPDVSVRIPSRIDFGAGQFQVLRALGGAQMTTGGEAGPVDMSSPTEDVVRAMRSGNPDDLNNGFLVDLDLPDVIGGWPLVVNDATQDPTGIVNVDLVLDMTFPTVCRQAPDVGDVIQVGSRFLEVTEAAAAPDGTGNVATVRARILGDPVGNPAVVRGAGLFLLPYDPASLVLPGCWVSFVPEPGTFPSFQVPTSAQALVRFSEPMDPATLTPFDSYMMVNGDSATAPTATNIVVGDVRPSTGLDQFVFTPVLPLAHASGVEEDYHIVVGTGTDLAGNMLRNALPPIDFSIDPLLPAQVNGGITLRFASPDEIGPLGTGPDGLFDWRGQFSYDLTREVMQPRPVAFSQSPADRTNPVPSLMFPLPTGSQTPLSPLGSKLQTLWRYVDVGFQLRDETRYDIDVIGLNWSPIGGQVLADFYEGFEIRLAHSKQLPDETTVNGLPNRPTSGLLGSPNFFTDNILVDPRSPQKIVHPRSLGYQVRPIDLFLASSGTQMMPYPLNREGAPTTTYTWRDTTVRALGGNNSPGIPLQIEVGLGLDPGPTGSLAAPGMVPSYGLPLLMEFRCYPSNSGVGLNLFDVSLAVALSSRPNFRAYSTGGVDTAGQQIVKNPDLELTPSGGFNPLSTPPGQKTLNDADNFFYIGQLDTVVRVSRVHSVWFDTTIFSPEFLSPVLEPSPDLQPSGTQILLDYRGASGFSGNSGNTPFDSSMIDPYGELLGGGTVTFFGGVSTWTSDIGAIDGARYIQIRMSFINNIETQLNAELSAIGLPFIGG